MQQSIAVTKRWIPFDCYGYRLKCFHNFCLHVLCFFFTSIPFYAVRVMCVMFTVTFNVMFTVPFEERLAIINFRVCCKISFVVVVVGEVF